MATITELPQQKTFKEKAFAWLGHDPIITETASTRDALASASSDLPGAAAHYVDRLFPFTKWILNYNLGWLTGDLIAGLTVGMVVVPQSMSYAKIATLPPQIGLYSSFVGVMIYWIFSTSKDVTIGPVAVMSLEVSKVIKHVQNSPTGKQYSAQEIASTLALICGIIVLGIGGLRLGWIVEFISAPAVSGFMTGSAISIIAGQLAGLMGYSNKFDTRASTYKVIINSFKYLPSTKRDAAYGLSGLFFLYAVRAVCNHFERTGRTYTIRRTAFFLGTLRTALTIIFLTLFAWVHLRHQKPAKYDISILKTVPSGFQNMQVPRFRTGLISELGSLLPVSTIILLLEHIAISKSFGRVNNYKIDPNQELIAIGITNVFTPFFGGYPATGSFSRTAIKSKAGVRTPLAGVITGIVVVVAIYGLTGAFYWIPNAGLSAVIIHAVGDLIASPPQVYAFWLVSPLEAIIFFGSVIITVFTTIEIGIYASVAASAALLLYRIAKPRGTFLGRVRIHSEDNNITREVFVPLNKDGVHNPYVKVEAPPPGVIVYRVEESFLYPNASRYVDHIADYAKETTRSAIDYDSLSLSQRPWNDPGPLRFSKKKDLGPGQLSASDANAAKPLLRAIVIDCSGISNIDSTSVQNLVDLRRVLERYSGQEVEFHFASILSPWIKRALLAGGFGRGRGSQPLEIAAVVPAGTEAVIERYEKHFPSSPPNGRIPSDDSSSANSKVADIEEAGGSLDQRLGEHLSPTGPLVSALTNRFHLDLAAAVAAAAGREW
ncbi:BZ3500_MvSof-1268-A1-R1_Chr7-1g09110 [Microbotryum saponariae]|uniref:BZ3500_MvSof-1268-A1-R1_Chr7-1g09110 protein n=1 Tax=Microbotryum saponariae TaxID=289078 RepID=A0A2X0LHF5_9BASI|nr:BZ3501_MvSof-1269-A2-R1_Chr7-1g08815 [Microbotryum saponariae]SDA02821.1 BZ3500_MvSof-1268-A1-R1_Chr7-1g09110 [Microbotryum saponariae]